LAGVWAHNVVANRLIAVFIRDQIESRYQFGWETAVVEQAYSVPWAAGIHVITVIYLGTEVVTVVLGLLKLKSALTLIDTAMLIFDAVAVVLTVIFMRTATQKPRHLRSG
jgi:hypothetical protein